MERGRFNAIVKSLFLNVCLFSQVALAHKGHTHEKPGPAPEVKVPEEKQQNKLDDAIIASYRENVEPIFRRTCFDCHSATTQFPWYSKLPFAKTLVQEDIAEARKHLDMTEGFPFKGHGSVNEDLQALEEDIRQGTMPPLRCRILHFQTRLSNEEREKILSWTGESLKRLQK